MAPACLWAAEETVTTREGALRSSSPRSKLVSRNGPRWLVAKVVSSPSAVSWRRGEITPALLTRTSSRPCRPRTSPASRRTCARLDRSAVMTSTWASGTRPGISAPAGARRAASRPTMTIVAPSEASRSAVSLPIPLLAPVTRQVVPDIAPTRPPVLGADLRTPAASAAGPVLRSHPRRWAGRRHDQVRQQVTARFGLDAHSPADSHPGGRSCIPTALYRRDKDHPPETPAVQNRPSARGNRTADTATTSPRVGRRALTHGVQSPYVRDSSNP